MSRRGWLLFGAMALLWGIPYLLIAIVVETIGPAGMVAGRTGIGALLLLPIALHRRALRPALARWPWVLAFAVIEMCGPFLLLGHAEQTLPSGITGLLVATVPLVGAVIAFVSGDRRSLSRRRVAGLAIGIVGVGLIVTGGGQDGSIRWVNVAEVLLVAVCYAIAPFIVSRRLGDVPGLGTATLALGATAVLYAPIALVTHDGEPSRSSLVSLLVLGVVCTAIAFVTFFALIGEVGPARATVFTYLNPVVAITLGGVILDEPITWGLLAGFPVVLVGCWLAAASGTSAGDEPIAVPEAVPVTDGEPGAGAG